ncbi:hypothetical protein AB1Y20_010386 [Prymnesium parvum]|uniref:PDZ domain-containing protein n=1 Tax=Prymnesium parvum TaxID=97485 RepID=A0AB34IPN6_PRYPA
MFASRKFDGNKCKVQLKMLINRFNLLTQKKANLAKQQKRQVAMLLRDEKEANARILVEHIIREDYTLEAYELLKQHTELLVARLNVVITEPIVKPEVSDSVVSIVYAGYLMGNEVPELKQLYLLFTQKYGKPYIDDVIARKESYLDQRLLKMLTSTQVPDPSVVNLYLTEIAKAYGVEYTPSAASSRLATSATIGSVIPVAQFIKTPAMPIAQPLSQPMSVPQPYSVTLTKSAAGLGLTLDANNVVTTVKPHTEAAASGMIEPGDMCLSLNGTPVSSSLPVKSVAIDIPEGAPATFVFLRGLHPAAPSPSNALPAGAPPPPHANSFGYPPLSTEPPVAAAPSADEDDVLAQRLEMLKLPRS